MGSLIAVLCTLTIVLSRALSPYMFVSDLLANISYLAIYPFGLAVAFGFFRRKPLLAIVAAIGLITSIAPVILNTARDRLRDIARTSDAAEKTEVKLLVCNLHYGPLAWERLKRIVMVRGPDIVVLIEADAVILEAIEADSEVQVRYPSVLYGKHWGQIILSSGAINRLRLDGSLEPYKYLFSCCHPLVVNVGEARLIVAVEHPPSPRNPRAWADGNHRLQLITRFIDQFLVPTGMPIVLAGDFNSTPTGHRDSILRGTGRLHGDPLGFFPKGSWPSVVPDFTRLPLDRVWGGPGIAFITSEVLEDVGSDHRPVYTRLLVSQPAAVH